MSTDKNRQVQIHVGDGSPILTQKYNRNAPCKCGSGKKQKHCCGNQTAFHLSSKVKEQIMKQAEEKALNASQNL